MRVREHSLAEVPVQLVVGKRETEERRVSVRRLGSQASTALAEALRLLADGAMTPNVRWARADDAEEVRVAAE